MLFTPRQYQIDAIEDGCKVLAAKAPAPLYASPTGSGKGVCLAGLLQRRPKLLCVVPNLDIGSSIYHKMTGQSLAEMPEAKARRITEANRIYTDKRAIIEARKGNLDFPEVVIDEAHHTPDDTHKTLLSYLGDPAYIGYTATPYRGTPKGTAELRRMFPGNIVTVLSLRAAADARFVSLPIFRTLPLLDDETIDVKGGEFVVTAVESKIQTRLGQFVEVLRGQYSSGRFARATTVVLPSVAAVEMVKESMEKAGLPSVVVVAGTTGRGGLYRQVIAGEAVLLQVRAVGEGVDLPLRVMYDLSPTMSPPLWMQRVGREMRPILACETCGTPVSDPDQVCCDDPLTRPVYYSCCHNLMRHGYLFEGLIPPAAFAEARSAWGDDWKPSRRTMSRALGNTGFGRFAPTEVPMLRGGMAYLYSLKAETGLDSYAALLLPHKPEPYYFHRRDAYTGRTLEFSPKPGVIVPYPEKQRGRWTRLDALPDLKGCVSLPPENIGDGAIRWWQKDARRCGLDPLFTPDRKQFTLLPILVQTGVPLE